jgi:hypothetical protein
MAQISGHDCSQLLLLPEAIDDYVGADNPVRFVDAFVDGLDLAAAGFARVEPKATGRPGYAPADLLKLYIYGYLNRVRSPHRRRRSRRDDVGRAASWRPPVTANIAETQPSAPRKERGSSGPRVSRWADGPPSANRPAPALR